MNWNLKTDRPIFVQLVEKLQYGIITGVYKPGEKLPSVRDLAAEASVNPNTMQRALAELERSGLAYSQRTNGRFITEDQNMITELKNDLAKETIASFLKSMKELGLSTEEVLKLLENQTKGESK